MGNFMPNSKKVEILSKTCLSLRELRILIHYLCAVNNEQLEIGPKYIFMDNTESKRLGTADLMVHVNFKTLNAV